jgi:hypothetical protein
VHFQKCLRTPAAAGWLVGQRLGYCRSDDVSCDGRRARERERAEVRPKSFWRSLAGFGGQRLGNRPMQRERCGRSVELCWPAITVVADSLLLGR